MKQSKLAVVTGGAGFIGSHLCEALHRKGYKVLSLDNYFTGVIENHISGIEYRRGHTKDIENLIPENPDIVFHLGEYARVEQSVLEPDLVYDLNTVGTKGVIELWRKKRFKLVYAGSSTKFGDDGKARYTSPYAETKAQNTELVKEIGDREQLPYAITYFYNVYGERERSGIYGTVIEQFKRMYLSGAPSAIVRPGTQVRNFTHVEDIVAGLLIVGEKGSGDEFGLGNEKAYSIFDVVELFGFGENSVLFPERPGNRMTSGLDTKKIRELGWETKHNLPEYIRSFTMKNTKGKPLPKSVLVFSTTMHPIAGLAEESLAEIARAIPDVHFDVITTRFTKNTDAFPSPASNIRMYRIGSGSTFDKYLLPILGLLKGLSLSRKQRYLFTWSLMASYAALAGLFLKKIISAPLLITLADQNIDDLSLARRTLFSLVLSSADQVYGTHGDQERGAMKTAQTSLPRNSIGEGDAFANALRYAYADIVRKRMNKI